MENLVSAIRREKGTTLSKISYDAVEITKSTFVNSYFYAKHEDDDNGLMLMISNVGQEFPICNVSISEYTIASRTPLPTPRKNNSYGSWFYWNYIATDRIYDDPELLYGIEWPSFFPKEKDVDVLKVISGRVSELEQVKRLLHDPKQFAINIVKDKAREKIIKRIIASGYGNEWEKIKKINTLRKIKSIKQEVIAKGQQKLYSQYLKHTKKLRMTTPAKKVRKIRKLEKLAKRIALLFI